jgi:hypothetical protein
MSDISHKCLTVEKKISEDKHQKQQRLHDNIDKLMSSRVQVRSALQSQTQSQIFQKAGVK